MGEYWEELSNRLQLIDNARVAALQAKQDGDAADFAAEMDDIKVNVKRLIELTNHVGKAHAAFEKKIAQKLKKLRK